MDLDSLRKEIDRVDREIVRLLDERAGLARNVAAAKASLKVPAYDPARHARVIEKITRFSNGAFPADGLRQVYREILSASLALQAPQKVGFLGPEATFSHLAAVRAFGSSVAFVPCSTVRDIFLAVVRDWVDFGLVPIENSMGGIVHATLDNFLENDVKVCQEVMLSIRQNLLCAGPMSSIKRVYSHPQGFLQCAVWLRENLPRAEAIEVASTALGVQRAKRDKHGAAIASELAADLYGLKIVARDIADTHDNVTRFLVISKRDAQRPGADPALWEDSKTSVMFSVPDTPGALYELLKPFARAGINLSKIESRPTKRRAWDYVFFVDIEGHIQDPKVSHVVESLGQHCQMIRILGSYPRDTLNKSNGAAAAAGVSASGGAAKTASTSKKTS